MFKHLQRLLLIAAICVPWVTQAQDNVISTFPWSCDFETAADNAVWSFTNAGNGWYIGTATNNTTGGNTALYVSDNNGTANNYSSSACVSYAYVTVQVASAGQYALQFDWKCAGESTYDFLRVAVAESTTTLPTAYTDWTSTAVPANFMAVDGGSKLNLNGTAWQTLQSVVTVPAAGTYRLIFVWRNDGSVYNQPPAAIDNVVISEMTCPQPMALQGVPSAEQISLSWTAGGSETNWMVVIDNTDAYYVTTPAYVATNLTPNTPYNFKVYAICGAGDTSLATIGNYRTSCVSISTMPYANDFENEPYYLSGTTTYAEAFPSCWTRINDATGTYNYYPYISNTANYVHSGNNGMYWYHTTTSGYAQNEYAVLPPIDLTAYNVSDLTLSFFAKTTSASYHPTPIVGVMTNPMDTTTFTPVYTFTDTEITTDWQLFAVPLSSYTGQGSYVAIKWPKPSSLCYLAIDDIFLTDEWCDIPGAVTATSTSTSLTVSWEANGGTSFSVALGNDTITGVTDTFYTFNNLVPDSLYHYGVARECTAVTSMFIGGSLRTECMLLTQLPYSNDFENEPQYQSGVTSYADAFPSCWTRINDATGTYNYYPYINTSSTYLINGEKSMYWYHTTTAGYAENEYAVLPGVDPSSYNVSDLTLSFYAKTTATTAPFPMFIVGVMTENTDASTFVPVDTITLTSTPTMYEVTFENYDGVGNYIAIRCPRTSSARYASLDDIFLTNEWCDVPEGVSALAGSEEITISWDDNGAGSYTVALGEDTISGVTDTFYTFTELTPNTQYAYGVASECTSANSAFIGGFIRTQCTALDSLPYLMDFENEATGSTTSHTFANCLTRLNNGTTYFGYPYISATSSYNHTPGGTKGLYWYGSTTATTYGDYQYVVMPPVDTTIYDMNTLQFTFWARSTSTSYNPSFQVGIMTDPNDPNSFQLVQTFNIGGNTTYTSFTVPFGNFEGYGNYIALRALRPTATWYATVDDLSIETMPNCGAVQDLAAVATVSNALLTWNYQEGFDAPINYEITYDSIGGSNPTTVTATDLHYAISGLEQNTTYKAIVRADCSDGYGVADSVTFVTGPQYSYDFDGGTTSTYYLPIGNYYKYSYTQQLVMADELNGPASLTGIEFEYAYSSPTTSKTDVSIYLANTAATSLSSAFVPYDSTFRLVYTGNLNCTQGWNTFMFDSVFAYDGTSNLLIIVHDNSNAYNGSAYIFRAHSATGKGRYVQNDSNPYTLSSVSGGTSTSYRANMKLHYDHSSSIVCAAPAVIVTGTTATTADMLWIPGNDETSWSVDYRLHDADTWTSAAAAVSATNYTVTGLNAGESYDFRVSFVCGDGNTYSTIVSANTECLPESLPYYVDFDNLSTSTTAADNYGVIPNCWDYIMTGGSSYSTGTYLPGVYYSTNYAYSGAYSLRLAGVGYFMLPEMSVSLDSLRITFTDTITSSSYNNSLIVGVMEDGVFVPIDTPSIVNTMRNFVEVSFRHYTGNSRTIALRNYYPSSTSTYTSYHYIDDVLVDYSPMCAHVENVAVVDATASSLTVNWEPVGMETSWEVACNGNTMIVTDTFVTINGLAANTLYTVEVRSICGADDTSSAAWIDARTACSALTTLPFVEDFESASTGTSTNPDFVSCWTRLNNGTQYFGYPYVGGSTYNHTPGGSKGLYWYNSTTATTYGDYQYIILPHIDVTALPINTLQLTFWARSSSSTYNPVFEVGVMNSNTDTAFTILGTVNVGGNTEWASFTTNLNGYQGTGAQYVAIRALRPTSSWYAYVDDITLDVIPACPRVEDLAVTTVMLTGATVSWSDTSSVNIGWNVEYDTVEFVPGTGHMAPIHVTDTFCVIAGLDSGTLYHVYVYPDCNGDAFYRHATFTTLAASPANVPYYCDFEANGVNGWDLVNDGQTNYWMVGNATSNGGNRSLYITNDDSSNTYTITSTSYSFATRVINLGVGGYVCSFDWKAQGESSYDFIRAALVPASTVINAGEYNGFNNTDGMPAGGIALDGEYRLNLNGESWQTQTSEFIITTPGTYKIVIMWRNDGSAGTQPPAAIDNVSIISNSCPMVSDIHVETAGTDYMMVDWTDVANASQWEVRYAEDGTTNWFTIYTSARPVTINNLDTLTAYNVKVRPICSATDTGAWATALLSTEFCDNALVASTGTATGTSYNAPVNNLYKYTLSETIIDSAELAGMTEIQAIAYSYAYSTAMTDKTDVTIWLQPTDKSVFTANTDMVALDSSTAVQVYSGNLNCSQGWNYFTFDTVFTWDGHSNLLVIVDDNSNDYNSSTYTFNSTSCTGYKTITWYSDSQDPDPTSTASYSGSKTYYQYRPTMKLVACGTGCRKPNLLPVSDLSYSSATINWSSAAADFEVAVKPATEALWPDATLVSANGYNVTGLMPATTYQYRVRAICDADEELVSDWVNGSFTTDSLPCFAPTELQNTAVELTTATFSWTSNGEETAWRIHVWNASFDQEFDVTTNPATVTGLTQNTTYSATVSALCGGGVLESDPSNTVEFTTAVCQPVTDVTATGITETSATITWTGSAASYSLEYGPGNFSQGSGTMVNDITGTSYTITGLTPGRGYTVMVRAHCDAQNSSEWSNRAAFTTLEEQGIEDVDAASVRIYPNPTSDATTIALSGVNGEVTVTVVDMNGRTVRTETMNCAGDCTKRMEVSGLAAGSYFVRISGEGVNTVKKLVVK